MFPCNCKKVQYQRASQLQIVCNFNKNNNFNKKKKDYDEYRIMDYDCDEYRIKSFSFI